MNRIGLFTATRREFDRFLRVPIQTLVSPWVSALLYILIFGAILGKRIAVFQGFSYIDFVLPGILMMNIIGAAFGQSSSSLFFQRFTRSIEEILVSPLTYTEMIMSYVLGAVLRAFIVATGIFFIALFFTQANLDHVFSFFATIILVSFIFSFLGLLVALWAEKFEQLSVLQTFVITPLIYVGGVFNSIDMLPRQVQSLARFNPFFVMVNNLRYSMISYTEASIAGGFVFLSLLALCLFLWTLLLFRSGYKLRN